MGATKKVWTRREIESMIQENDKAAMRAVCALFRQQRLDEKRAAETKHKNFRGFSQAHAKVGTELARWMTRGHMDGQWRRKCDGAFSEWKRNPHNVKTGRGRRFLKSRSPFAGRSRIEVCREIALHYAGQLTRIANGRI